MRYEPISEAEIDLATFFILLFILNEGYSIFHENLPKCGINIWDSLRKFMKVVKTLKSDFNEIKE